jgi:actin-like ATPase involved in cell morphogenesis
MNKKEDKPITKKDLIEALEDQAQTIIEAINFGFEKTEGKIQGIKESGNNWKQKY